MGDVAIRIRIPVYLINNETSSTAATSSSHARMHVLTLTWSADSTLSEVIRGTPILHQLFSLPNPPRLYDCSLHPPQEIELTSTRTLYDAGWFPSAVWCVIPNTVPRGDNEYEFIRAFLSDSTEEATENSMPSLGRVTLAGETPLSSRPTPSQVLHSVKERFANEPLDDNAAAFIRRANRQARQQRQVDRQARLQRRIDQLQAGTNTSQQVRRMLIKSRATGRPSISLDQRLYFHCLVLVEEEEEEAAVEEYLFFSRQDSIGQVLDASRRPPGALDLRAELLVPKIQASVPVLYRLYECLERGFLQEFDTFIIRWFPPGSRDRSPSIDDVWPAPKKESLTLQNDNTVEAETATAGNESTTKCHTTDAGTETHVLGPTSETSCGIVESDTGTNALFEDAKLSSAIPLHDMTKKKLPSATSKAPKSSAAAKVRQMQIKSHALGNAKRIPNQADRFYLQVVVVATTAATPAYTVLDTSPVYMSCHDPVDRLVRDHARPILQASFAVPGTAAGASDSIQWDVLRCVAPAGGTDDSRFLFCKISDTAVSFRRLSEAKGQESVQQFDRVVVMFRAPPHLNH
jgi:hypothetical protein